MTDCDHELERKDVVEDKWGAHGKEKCKKCGYEYSFEASNDFEGG